MCHIRRQAQVKKCTLSPRACFATRTPNTKKRTTTTMADDDDERRNTTMTPAERQLRLAVDNLMTNISNIAGTLDIGSAMGCTDYIDFIHRRDLGDATAVRGVDKYRRPFVAFAGRIAVTFTDGVVVSHSFMQTMFQRYTDDPLLWMACGNSELPNLITSVGGASCDQLNMVAELLGGENTFCSTDTSRIANLRFIIPPPPPSSLSHAEEREARLRSEISAVTVQLFRSDITMTNDDE